MTNKELNNEQLENVSGGLVANERQYYERYTRKLDKYETEKYIGQNLYFVCEFERNDEKGRTYTCHTFIYGTLNNSYEKTITCTVSTRTANVTVIDSQGNSPQRGTIDISLDNWVAYAQWGIKI